MEKSAKPARSRPAERLTAHRLILALALFSVAPPLVLHDGWKGALVAIVAAAYGVYLLAGKRRPAWLKRGAKKRKPAGKTGGDDRHTDGHPGPERASMGS